MSAIDEYVKRGQDMLVAANEQAEAAYQKIQEERKLLLEQLRALLDAVVPGIGPYVMSAEEHGRRSGMITYRLLVAAGTTVTIDMDVEADDWDQRETWSVYALQTGVVRLSVGCDDDGKYAVVEDGWTPAAYTRMPDEFPDAVAVALAKAAAIGAKRESLETIAAEKNADDAQLNVVEMDRYTRWQHWFDVRKDQTSADGAVVAQVGVVLCDIARSLARLTWLHEEAE